MIGQKGKVSLKDNMIINAENPTKKATTNKRAYLAKITWNRPMT